MTPPHDVFSGGIGYTGTRIPARYIRLGAIHLTGTMTPLHDVFSGGIGYTGTRTPARYI